MGPQLDHPAHEVSEHDYWAWRKAQHNAQKQRVLQATTYEQKRDVYPERTCAASRS